MISVAIPETGLKPETILETGRSSTQQPTIRLVAMETNRHATRITRSITKIKGYTHTHRLLENDDGSSVSLLERPQPLKSISQNTAQSNIETGRSSTQQPTLLRPVAMETIKHATTMICSIDKTDFMSNDQVVPDTHQTTFNYPITCSSSRAEDTTLPFQQYANGT